MRLWPRRRVYVDDLPETHDTRFLLAFLLMLVGVLGAVYAVGYVVAGDKVPTGTTVVGVEIGGMTRETARGVLERRMDAQLRRPLTASAGTRAQQLVPVTSGISFDVDATIDDAMGGSDWDPRHMLNVVQGGALVEPVLRVDAPALRSALHPLAADVAVAPEDARISVRASGPVIAPGRPGQRLDVTAARAPIVSAVGSLQRSARLRLATVDPAVDAAAARAFVDDTIRPALDGPVVVALGRARVTVPASRFGPALRVQQTGSDLHLGIAADDLFARTVELLRAAPGHPVNAHIVFRGNGPVIVASRPGTVVDRQAWADAVLSAATAGTPRRAVADVRTARPSFTTSDARALRIEVPVGVAVARARSLDRGVLAIATGRLDGSVVLPGARFSYARAVTAGGAAAPPALASPLWTATHAAAVRGGMVLTNPPGGAPDGAGSGFVNATDWPVYLRAWLERGAGAPATVHVQLWSSRAAA